VFLQHMWQLDDEHVGNGHVPSTRWHGVCPSLQIMTNMRPHTHEPVGQETVPMATSHGLTLLDVIQAVSEVAENDLEIIVTVVHLISSGQVRLPHDAIGAMRQLVATVHAAAQGPAAEQTRQWHDATQDAAIIL
jgi:hypothetical protein